MCQVDEKTRGAQSQRGKGGRGSQSTTEHSREHRPARHLKLSWQWVECLSWAVLYYIASCCALQHADAFLPSVRSMIRLHHFSYHLLRAKKGTKKKKPNGNVVTVNRIAYRNYEIVDTLEAGISLKGTEVKSIRDGKINMRDGFVRADKDGRSCTLYNVHIGKCSQVGSEYFQHEETRPRTLLVHKEQARKLMQQTEQQGMTIVPLKAYWNDQNKLKLQIGLARGKNVRDKRQTIQERDAKREANRIIKNFRI